MAETALAERQKYTDGRQLPATGNPQVDIPKPNGDVRTLGIPTVADRFIQQAIAQALTPYVEPTFSKSSYGFRPNRNAGKRCDKHSSSFKAANAGSSTWTWRNSLTGSTTIF